MKTYLTLILSFFFALTSAHADKVEFKIGATLPLSGRLAYVGEDIRRGLELGVNDFSSDKLAFKIILEDNQYEAKQAASSAEKLCSQDHVDLIVSLWDMADVVAPIAERYKTPHIAIRWNPHIAEKYLYTFTMESTYKQYVLSQIELLKSLHIKKIALLTEEAAGWILGNDFMKENAAANGLEVVVEDRYLNDNPDYRSIVLRLLRKQPEMIVHYGNPPHTEIFIRRIREIAPKQKFTGYFDYTPTAVELVEGVPFVAQFATAPWFEDKFFAKYHDSIKARAPHAYDIVKLISTVHANAEKKVGGTQFMEALNHIKNLPGASGTLSATSTRNILNEPVWKICRNGKYELYK